MFQVLTDFIDGVLGYLVGGGTSSSVLIGVLVLIICLVIVLLVARLGFEVSLIIVSPGIIVASFHGFLPALSFGIIVLLLGLFWTGLILALAR